MCALGVQLDLIQQIPDLSVQSAFVCGLNPHERTVLQPLQRPPQAALSPQTFTLILYKVTHRKSQELDVVQDDLHREGDYG